MTPRASTPGDAGNTPDPWTCATGHHHPVPSLADECDAKLEQATRARSAA